MAESSLIVVALGGNAISRSDEEGNVDQQFANARKTASALADLVQAGHRLIVTHGNGPQIGNFLLRNEIAAYAIYPLPMEVAVAHVQGGMGFMIAQTLTNELQRRGDDRVVTAIVSTVLVDADDPSFAQPSKPIGRALTWEEAAHFQNAGEWSIKEVSLGKYRRVVPSPQPRRIMEIETIRRAVQAGDILVTCGGGGVPVVNEPGDGLRGVRAVIDKDLASALLAAELNADTMLILTDVERVAINFGMPDERRLERMSLAEAEGWMQEGQFPPGSMGPKVQGAINFVRQVSNPRAVCFIGPLDRAGEVLTGAIGTRIER